MLLFIARYFLPLNTWIANFACWLVDGDSVGVNDSHKIFNVDCRVSLGNIAQLNEILINVL